MKDVHPFVRHLYGLAAREDRAALATLRRSFASPLAAMPFVVPFLRKGASSREESALVLVAGLFSIHPNVGSMSLARALSLIARESDSVELRFRALLNADAEDLPTHLRHGVSLARSKELSLDYDDLLWTVLGWGREDNKKQRAWAREFWGAHETTEEATS